MSATDSAELVVAPSATTPTAEPERRTWSLRIGRIAGIPIDVHATFLLLLAWLALAPLAEGASIEKGLSSAGFTVLVFGTVVLHELGHALVARRFGYQTQRILLLPIGGIASLSRMPTRPIEELLVAIAGPAVNVVLALLLGGACLLVGEPLVASGIDQGSLLARLFWVNVALCVFNLLPAFPMDGGRALRAVLSTFTDRVRATALAAAIGRALAVALGVFGLAFQPMLALVAIFVWSAGRVEASMEEAHAALAGVRVRDGMTPHVDVVDAGELLGPVAERLLADRPHDVVVEREGAVVGMLTRGDLVRALTRGEIDRPVGDVMHARVAVASPSEAMEDALERLAHAGSSTIVVVDAGHVVGVVDATTLGDQLVLARARTRVRRGASPRG